MNNPTWNDTSGHLRYTLELSKLEDGLRRAEHRLRPMQFDAIAVTGLSGIVFGSALALRLGKPLLIVRKKETPTPHSFNEVEGPDQVGRYVFVDDLVASGSTLQRVLSAVRDAKTLYGGPYSRWPGAYCIGVYCYCEPPDRPWTTVPKDLPILNSESPLTCPPTNQPSESLPTPSPSAVPVPSFD